MLKIARLGVWLRQTSSKHIWSGQASIWVWSIIVGVVSQMWVWLVIVGMPRLHVEKVTQVMHETAGSNVHVHCN